MASVTPANMSSNTSSSSAQAEPNLHAFAALPTELQLMVWDSYVPTPRVISVGKDLVHNGRTFVEKDFVEVYGRQSLHPNPLLHTCRQSRQTVLKKLVLTSRRGDVSGHSDSSLPRSIPIYVDPQFDIFDFGQFRVQLRQAVHLRQPRNQGPAAPPGERPICTRPISEVLGLPTFYDTISRVSLSFGLKWMSFRAMADGSLDKSASQPNRLGLMNSLVNLFPQAERMTILSERDWVNVYAGTDHGMEDLVKAVHGATGEDLSDVVLLLTRGRWTMFTYVKNLGRGVFFIEGSQTRAQSERNPLGIVKTQWMLPEAGQE